MAAKPYIKLDTDWYDDPKILDFQDRYGKAALVDVVKLFCVLGEFYGSIDLKDNGQKIRLQQVLGKKGKALSSFLEKAASCGIISAEALEGIQRVGSDRSVRDGTARRNRRDYAIAASQAAAEKRNEAKGEP